MTTSSLSDAQLKRSVELIELKPGIKFSVATLQELLPDVESALFFAKVYELDYTNLSLLLSKVLRSNVAAALFSGDHSTDLQHYLVGWTDEDGVFHPGIVPTTIEGEIVFKPNVPKGEILPEIWKDLEVTVAQSIKDVAAKLETVISHLPGKQGAMVFESMMVMNRKRPTIGDYKAKVRHERQARNLLVLDVSGSMSEGTVRAIVDDVVALSYMANADVAIVSNDTFYWEAGTYDSDALLKLAQFGGTHYETLSELMNQDWGTVITIADYDSSYGAKEAIARCTGSIAEIVDISLVNRPTFLAECLGQIAGKVTPILVATGMYPLHG